MPTPKPKRPRKVLSLPQLRAARACTVCAPHLPLGPRPLLAVSRTARLVIIGQAPGRAAHESGIPWNDKSGERLREWLGITPEVFYDDSRVALLPMGFCYPGTGRAGDLAPRPECAPLWHDKLLRAMKNLGLTVFIGRYAFERYLGDRYEDVTEAVKDFKVLLPERVALPHPSPRNNIWLKKNPWFRASVVPALQRRVKKILDGGRPR